VVPRVLAVQERLDVSDPTEFVWEQAVVTDGEAALALLDRERFDAVLLDLNLPPIDSWLVLAALGGRAERPRIVVAVGDQNEVERAQALGADVCVVAGTTAPARALTSAWQRHQTRGSRPTPSSVRG
jgi:DNA-binding response OmpR family regulator